MNAVDLTIPPDEFPDFPKFCEFVRCELGDIPVLDQGSFISPKISYYWRTWRSTLGGTRDMYLAKKHWHHMMQEKFKQQGANNGRSV